MKGSVKSGTKRKRNFFFALLFALEVMVTARPHALGLATPTITIVAREIGIEQDVLFRCRTAAIESASIVRTIVFCKTGTLTNDDLKGTAVTVAVPKRAATKEVER